MKTRLSVTILWVLLHLLLCLFVLFLLSSPLLLKVVNWFPILIWKTRAAFSTWPLLRAVNCAYGQHESCFWCGRAASVHSTLFLLDLLKTAPQGGSEGTAACITRPLSHGGAHRGIFWNWVQSPLIGTTTNWLIRIEMAPLSSLTYCPNFSTYVRWTASRKILAQKKGTSYLFSYLFGISGLKENPITLFGAILLVFLFVCFFTFQK